MFSPKVGSVGALISLTEAFLWAAIAAAAGTRRAPLGVIELLLLFATLVTVPLGLELARLVSLPVIGRLGRVARAFQPFAAAATVVSLWKAPGVVAAALSLPWLLLGLLLALSGVLPLFHKSNRSLENLAVGIAGIDLAIAAGWLLMSRAGLRPMGFQEPIALLTAVHFHYIGFATALIAAAALHVFDRYGVWVAMLRPVVWLVLLLPFALAAGFVLSPLLRVVTAVLLSASVTALAGLLFWFGRDLHAPTARIYLRFGSGAAWISMGLAGVYAVSDHAGRPFLTMPGMASTHGVLNGLGFVLLSTLALLGELHANGPEGQEARCHPREQATAVSDVPRKQPAPVLHPTPEFVARDFYDR
jgi:hypothetical protein